MILFSWSYLVKLLFLIDLKKNAATVKYLENLQFSLLNLLKNQVLSEPKK